MSFGLGTEMLEKSKEKTQMKITKEEKFKRTFFGIFITICILSNTY